MSTVDRWDVEAMIRDAAVRARSETAQAIREALRELREELAAERIEREDEDERLGRLLDSRTEHLA